MSVELVPFPSVVELAPPPATRLLVTPDMF